MVGKGLKTIRVESASFEMIRWNPRPPHAPNEEFQGIGTCRGLRNLSKKSRHVLYHTVTPSGCLLTQLSPPSQEIL